MTDQEHEMHLKEITPLVQHLLDASSLFVESHGNFLPHGASLDKTGTIALCAAAGENDMTNATEVLPLLHDGLRTATADLSTQAVAVSESVYIGPDQRPAIKVLVEHRAGVTLAFYQTWKKRLLRGIAFGDVQVVEADPEVGNWAKPHFLA